MQDEQTGVPPGELPNLSEENHRFLRDLAREAVERHVRGEPSQPVVYDDPNLKKEWGVFVTLRTGGNLRGCLGNIVSDKPLPEAIADLAVKSASFDPRFSPVGPAELDGLSIDVSILSPLQEIHDPGEIVVGRDGLVIEKGGRHGLLLPQVATEQRLDATQFLSQTCLKAGLQPDAWKQGARIYRFSAEVF